MDKVKFKLLRGQEVTNVSRRIVIEITKVWG